MQLIFFERNRLACVQVELCIGMHNDAVGYFGEIISVNRQGKKKTQRQ
jgi:hypothetical protein